MNDFYKYYRDFLENNNLEQSIESELLFERFYKTNTKTSDVLNWFESAKKNSKMTYSVIPLEQCKGWSISKESGSFVHESGGFFRVDGIRVINTVDREVTGGWDQPILTQVDYDGGILGVLRTKINGVPHYLVEAKSEPGNFGITQITTTLQATFSNLRQEHKGKKPVYAEYFYGQDRSDCILLIDSWMSEDGGRLLNKRNNFKLVHINDVSTLEIGKNHMWVDLKTILEINRRPGSIISPHLRCLLSLS